MITMDDLLIGVVAIVPAALTAGASYAAARHAARRDMAEDRARVIESARQRASQADDERAETRDKLLDLERKFDKLRAALRDVVQALHSIDSTHEALAPAHAVLDELVD